VGSNSTLSDRARCRPSLCRLFCLSLYASTYASQAARRKQSSTAEAERYIKESESQWAESVANGDASLVERILADDFAVNSE
jgi:hypothetical protein